MIQIIKSIMDLLKLNSSHQKTPLFNVGLQFIIQMEQQNSKGKTVELYILERLVEETSYAQYWSASHKVLKKHFILKKIKGDCGSKQASCGLSSVKSYRKAQQQTNLLNEIKIEGRPKCHKLIRTTNNAYLVFDPYAGCSLGQFIELNSLSHQKALTIMLHISLQLEKYHSKNLVLLSLSPSNIFITESIEISFTDWSTATKKGNLCDSQFLELPTLSTPLAKNDGVAREISDIFSLGSIFGEIVMKSRKNWSSQAYEQMKDLIDWMTGKKAEKQVVLSKIISSLKEKIIYIIPEHNKCYFLKKKSDSNDFSSRTNSRTIKRNLSECNGMSLRFLEEAKSRVKLSNEEEEPAKQTIPNISTSPSLRYVKKVDDTTTNKLLKGLFQKRSFSLFLLSLSEAINGQNSILCLLLLKKALIASKEAQSQAERLKQINITSAIKARLLLQSQTKKIEQLISKLRSVEPQLYRNKSLHAEMTNLKKMIDPIYFTEQVREFAKSQLSQKMVRQNQLSQTSEFFFQVYMLTKQIQYGSYDFFWDRISKQNDDGFQNKTYFNYQKKLGLRYFKCKIEAILNK